MIALKSFLARHTRAAVAGTATVVAAAGVTVGLLATGATSGAAAAPTTPTTLSPAVTAPAAPSGAGAAAGRHHARARTPQVRGTITTISPSQWTLTTAKGKTFTVVIGPATRYGTPKAPATASSFATGESVVVLGARQGSTITATRIAAPRSASGTTSTTTPTTAPAG